MKENDIYKDIRRLLGRWYSGETSPVEEERLADLLSGVRDLPADLEADRYLFGLLVAEKGSAPEIPAETAARIALALDREIAATSDSGSRKRRHFIGRNFRLAATGIAACLAIVFATHRFADSNPGEASTGLVADLVTTTSNIISTLTVDSLANEAPAPRMIASATLTVEKTEQGSVATAGSPRPKKKVKTGVAKSASASKSLRANGSDQDGNTIAAQTELARPANYRIVESYDEADAILSSILSKMSQYVDVESSRISEIGLEYASEVQKVNMINEISISQQIQKI